jgi:hypothetical protein
MTRRERLLLLVLFAGLLALLAGSEPTATALGGVVGLAAGVVAAGRLRRVSARIDARLGADEPRPGFSWRRPLLRAGAQLVVLGGLLMTTALVPFVGDELFAGTAAAVTALPLVLTAARLRR